MQDSRQAKSISDLNRLYSEADTADQDIFAEQRSNILLIAGDHYTRKNSKYWNRIRDTKDLSNEQKLRLTKNHIQRITKNYVNNIINHAPSVKPIPNNEKELQDQKSAELNDSVWQYARHKHNLRKKTQQFAKDFIDIGEVAAKIYWDPNAGQFLGYEARVDEMGQPEMGEDGQMVSSGTPRFQGDIVIERVYAFNLLRDPAAKSMEESKFFIYRKMVGVEELKALIGNEDEEKLRILNESKDGTFLVFDGNQQNYSKSEGQCLLREFYYKPCVDYPQGYFYITVEGGILFEGELPFGVMPIIFEGFDEIQTSPRHRSIVKQLRPYQAELNRAASKIAEHQVTLGDDKLLVQSGSKVTTGVHLPGIRSIQFSGMAPTILSGRAGDQYFNYMKSQIDEMYQVANMKEDFEQKNQNADPFGSLFMSLRDKKKFSIYGEKFESFLIKLCQTYLELARQYFTPDMLIPIVGKSEFVNIAEFKTTNEFCYSIKLEPMSDDLETMMGRQLAINHTLQYVGGNLPKEDVGRLIRSMPFGNMEQSFSDLTLEYDTATNMILALDRGQQVLPNKYDEHIYMSKRLVSRMRASDFAQLDPQIQENYQNMVNIYEELEVKRQQEIKAAQEEFIPSGGARIKVDYYVNDPKNPDRPVRATLPAESLDWLIKQLAEQGSSQEMMTTLNQGLVADMAGKFNQQVGQGMSDQQMPQPMQPQQPRYAGNA